MSQTEKMILSLLSGAQDKSFVFAFRASLVESPSRYSRTYSTTCSTGTPAFRMQMAFSTLLKKERSGPSGRLRKKGGEDRERQIKGSDKKEQMVSKKTFIITV